MARQNDHSGTDEGTRAIPPAAAAGAGVPGGRESEPAVTQRHPDYGTRFTRQVGYEYDPVAGTILWGTALPEVLGYERQDLDGKVSQWFSWLHPGDRDNALARLRDAEARLSEYDVEYRVRHRNGNYLWVRDRGCFLPGPSGRKALRMVGLIEDVSDPHSAGEALHLDEQRLDAVLRLSQMTSATLQEITDFALEEAVRLTRSTIGYLAFMNADETVLTMHSWSRSVLAECNVRDSPRVYPVATTGLWGEAVRQRRPVITNDYAAPSPLKHGMPEGHVLIQRHMNVPVFDGECIVAVAGVGNKVSDYDETDVRQLVLLMRGMWRLVQRQRVDAALRESEARYRSVVENSLVGICISKDETILYANQTLIRMGGYDSFAELAAKPVSAHLTPASAALANELFQSRSRGEPVPSEFDLEALRKDGSVRIVRLCTSPVHLGEQKCELSTFLDVTEQRRAERERLEMQRRLLHTQKLESLGVLAGGIAHDFNNLLMAILGNLDMALSDLPEGSPARFSIEQAVEASHRATDLTNEMLAYSGRGRFVLRRIDLSNLIRETAELLRAALVRTVELDLRLASEGTLVEADPGQMQQVAMNLITNAAEALGERSGAVTLSTGVVDCSEGDLAASRLEEKPRPGRFVYLRVSDNGCGMDETTQQRLFDPFYTTKAAGRGLGMSAVLGIVRGHHGAIMVDSQVGSGTTVRVLFPALAPDEPRAEPARASRARPAAAPVLSGLLLVVDDDEAVRGLALAYARRLGLEAIGAGDGEEALALFRQNPDRIGGVLLDLTMPRLDGAATYRELRRLCPDLPVILCSGYTEQDAAQRFHGEGLAGFLQKPYELRQLRRLLETLPTRSA